MPKKIESQSNDSLKGTIYFVTLSGGALERKKK